MLCSGQCSGIPGQLLRTGSSCSTIVREQEYPNIIHEHNIQLHTFNFEVKPISLMQRGLEGVTL